MSTNHPRSADVLRPSLRAAGRILVLTEGDPEPEGEQYRFNVRLDGPDGGGLLLSLNATRSQAEFYHRIWTEHVAGVIDRVCGPDPARGPEVVGPEILDLHLSRSCPEPYWQWWLSLVTGDGATVAWRGAHREDPDGTAARAVRAAWHAHFAAIVREELPPPADSSPTRSGPESGTG